MSQASRNLHESFRQLWEHGTLRGLTSEELLNRFVMRGDEQAFASLVTQFGPMVYTVCRSVLQDEHAAADAFQATFLLLARKAGSVRSGSSVGSWLHRTARRVAIRSARRTVGQPRHSSLDELNHDPPAHLIGHALEPDLVRLIHEEVDRLPATQRAAVVACDLEGLTHQQAADQLRWPLGTVKGRLFRAHRTLQTKLSRRGITALALPLPTGGSIPYSLVQSTAHLAATAALGSFKKSLVPASVAALVTGEIHMSWLKTAVLSGCLLAAGTGLTAGAMKLANGPSDQPVRAGEALGDDSLNQEAPPAGNTPAQSNGDNQASNPMPLLTPENRQKLEKELQTLRDSLELSKNALQFETKMFEMREARLIEAEKAVLEMRDQISTKQTLNAKPGEPQGQIDDDDLRKLKALENIRNEAIEEHDNDQRRMMVERSRHLERLHDQESALLEQLSAPSTEPRRIRPGDKLVIEVLEALPGRPITGERLVRSDGTVGLFFYGDVRIAGLNRYQAKAAIIRHLRKYLSDETLGLAVVDDQGKKLTVAPEDSAAVVVDDTSAELEDLRRKRESEESRPNPARGNWPARTR